MLCKGAGELVIRPDIGSAPNTERAAREKTLDPHSRKASIAIVERFFLALKTEMLCRLAVVPFRLCAMQREVTAYTFWYNQHRPHTALGGRTPAEVRDGLVAACDRPALEPRGRFPLARGQPARMARRLRGKLELVLEHVDGRTHLPIVSLRRAA